MAKVTFALYSGRRRWVSRFLNWWMGCRYSHVEAVLGANGTKFVCASSSFLDGGVRQKTIDLSTRNWTLYEIEAKQHPHWWFTQHRGEGYDFIGLLGFVIRPIKGYLRAWWCSEACAASIGIEDSWRYDVGIFASMLETFGTRIEIKKQPGDPK